MRKCAEIEKTKQSTENIIVRQGIIKNKNNQKKNMYKKK